MPATSGPRKRGTDRKGAPFPANTVRSDLSNTMPPSQTGRSNQKSALERSQMLPPPPRPPSPTPISFLFHVEDVSSNVIHNSNAGHWSPPLTKREIQPPPSQRISDRVYRWRGGTVTPIEVSSLPIRASLSSHPDCPFLYKCCTVWTQEPEDQEFLAVAFDARHKNVSATTYLWPRIGLDHSGGSFGGNTYSYIRIAGERVTEVPRDAPWSRELFPADWLQGANDDTNHAGLIGEIGLIIALAAFSARPSETPLAMSRFQNFEWMPHNRPHGRSARRGLVVTIWRDPVNESNSSLATLNALKEGEHGGFLHT